MKNLNIEVARVLGLAAVVTIHVRASSVILGPDAMGFVLDELSRVAVPLFFTFSGYLWKDSVFLDTPAFIRRISLRMLVPFAVWLLVYLFIDETGLVQAPVALNTPQAWEFLIVGGDPGYHLWFLPALWIASTLAVLLIRNIGERFTFALAAIIFLLACYVGAYSRLQGHHPLIITYRNGVGFGFPLVVLGYYIQRIKVPLAPAFTILVLGAVGQIAEGWWLGPYPRSHDFSLSTLIYVFGAAVTVLAIKKAPPHWLASLGQYVFSAYALHLFIVWVFAALVPIRNIWIEVSAILFCTTVSMLGAIVIDKTIDQIKATLQKSATSTS